MLKIKFIGVSDSNFINGNIYTLIEFKESIRGIKTIITDEHGKLRYVPYSTLASFNRNWKVVKR